MLDTKTAEIYAIQLNVRAFLLIPLSLSNRFRQLSLSGLQAQGLSDSY